MVISVPTLAITKVKTGLPPKLTSSAPMIPERASVPVAVAAVVLSYTLLFPVRPEIVNSFAVISPDKVGWVRVYFDASAPDIVKPVVVIVIPVPTLALAKVYTVLPPKNTSSPVATPTIVAVPVAVAAVLLSYTLLFPVSPEMVRTP